MPSSSGIDLLMAVAEASLTEPSGVTATRLAALTGRDRGVVARVVDDLCDLGLLDRDPASRRLRLGWGLYTTAAQLVEHRLVTRAQPILERLATTCGESAYLVRRRGSQSITVAEALPSVSVRGVSWLGRSHPVASADAGPVLLGDLTGVELSAVVADPAAIGVIESLIAEIGSNGSCAIYDLSEPGVGSIAAPVHDFRGRLLGALVVVGPSERIRESASTMSVEVRAAARELSSSIGAPA